MLLLFSVLSLTAYANIIQLVLIMQLLLQHIVVVSNLLDAMLEVTHSKHYHV
jgi:hypothetical protein